MNIEKAVVVSLTLLGHIAYGWIGAYVGFQLALILGGLLSLRV